ncbi:UNVERIFIED_CONTAM: Retrovirus-related Pol polyprotein from transposon TNT 1-94 [Sesamum calycinum]|uniref:Retrovirus-related Pol polyprotein from transposon TNT 1-94 n=1 Tax=Sesamum calycinum TaxID=2727403 RepID=A0AAW2M8R4_9LAMI
MGIQIETEPRWQFHQLDINNAFLHGHLDEEVYMTPLEGYLVQPGMVCRLHKSLYGLKQASRQWNHEFTQTLGYWIRQIVFGLGDCPLSDGMSVTQRKYINDIIIDTGMTDAHSILTPLPHGVKFSSELGAPLSDPEKYRRLIGRLLYLGFTCPDLPLPSNN